MTPTPDLWADPVAAWATGNDSPTDGLASKEQCTKLKARDDYVYFNNDMKLRAPFDAENLSERVSDDWSPELELSLNLFL
jgi:uncharacterized protein YecE (DUF72 family)